MPKIYLLFAAVKGNKIRDVFIYILPRSLPLRYTYTFFMYKVVEERRRFLISFHSILFFCFSSGRSNAFYITNKTYASSFTILIPRKERFDFFSKSTHNETHVTRIEKGISWFHGHCSL